MKKTAVVYWSGTGNTEAMAKAVAEGMESAGAQVTMLTPDQVKASELSAYDAIAFGCPARAPRCSAPTAGATASGCAAGKRTAMIPASALCARA